MRAIRHKGALLFAGLLAISSTLTMPCRADLAIIVNPTNPITELSSREVTKIFMGRLRMYPDTQLETTVIDQNDQQPAFRTFYMKMLNMNTSKLMRYRASYLFSGQGHLPTEALNDDEVKLQVANTPEAIGYIEASAIDDSVRVVYSLVTD